MSEETKATIDILEHYHLNGGYYEIPVEIINTVEQELEELDKLLQQKENIIKEVREYIEKNWISQKDADNYRFDDEELDIEISDIAVLFDILDKEVN